MSSTVGCLWLRRLSSGGGSCRMATLIHRGDVPTARACPGWPGSAADRRKDSVGWKLTELNWTLSAPPPKGSVGWKLAELNSRHGPSCAMSRAHVHVHVRST